MVKTRSFVLVGGAAILIGLALGLLFSPSRPEGRSASDQALSRTDRSSSSRAEEAAPGAPVAPFVSFTPQKDEYALTTDPDDPSYDPTALVMTMNMRAESLFKLEKREPTWASQVERRIDKVLANDYKAAFPGMDFVVESECASATCLVRVQVPEGLSDAARMAAEFIPQWASLATSIELTGSDSSLRFAITFAKDRRDLATFDRMMAEERREVLGGLAGADTSKIENVTFREAHVYLTRLRP